ncbi:hypothetical protein PF010_g10757 [Phytophthora fragariae]|uniref:PiggyBac transposable element-derived protein domain-containing protein n=1 Tax=Phytophthora fragariae TaxID=53985 RepID=A0A6A3UKQ2_9STRA|nr:hypothetical protein PF010_g10757 [Phytophthora fragariae]KAE9151779.1 hypothetical protein PF006_g3955 [Phytophthora fragariae]
MRCDDRFDFFTFHHHTIEKGDMTKRKHEPADDDRGKDKRRRLPRTRQCTATGSVCARNMYVASGIEKDDSSDEDYIMKGISEPEEAIAIDEFDVERAPG